MASGTKRRAVKVRITERILGVTKEDLDESIDIPLRTATDFENIFEQVEFILVYDTDDLTRSLKRVRIKHFLRNLQKIGLTIEQVRAVSNENIIFVKVSADKEVLYQYAPGFGILLHCNNPFFQPENAHLTNIFSLVNKTEIKKATNGFNTVKLHDITPVEKMLVIFKILKYTKYGIMDDEIGIEKLLQKQVFLTIYPMHDPEKETLTGTPLSWSDRQILLHYWASWTFLFKRQPTFLVQKYFGAEVAFYFAFLGHYVRMLMPAAVIGITIFLFGVLTVGSENDFKSKEVCKSSMLLCPKCPNFVVCQYTYLNESCFASRVDYILDNQSTVLYGVFMSIWSTVALELWKREEAFFAYQWNVYTAQVDMSIRAEYETNATLKRLSPITGEWEACEDTNAKYCHTFVSIATVAFLMMVAICTVIAVNIHHNAVILSVGKTESLRQYAFAISRILSSLVSIAIMEFLEIVYRRIAKWLVRFENPRTEQEYDNSYIHKTSVISFINSYGYAIHLAFFKGGFYTHPGDEKRFGSLKSDQCDATGCGSQLFIHVFIVLITKSILKDVYKIAKSALLTKWKKFRLRNIFKKKLPSYEHEYYLKEASRFYLIDKYRQYALIYGYAIFFSAVLSVAPVIALFHTLIKIRTDAKKFLKNYRRPIPIRVSGLGAWKGVFRIMTHLGVIINALVIGLTLTFVPTQIAFYRNGTSQTYYKNRLSIFDTDDYDSDVKGSRSNLTHPATCYYNALRYPPGHPNKYELTGEFWFEMTVIFIFIIVFEQTVLAITGILSYVIPDVPESIKDTMEHERLMLIKKNLASKSLNETAKSFVKI